MKNNWIKIVARNQQPLHFSAHYHKLMQGIKYGDIFFKQTKALVIEYDSPLAHAFNAVGEFYKTNLSIEIEKKSKQVDRFFQQAVLEIRKILKTEKGDSKQSTKIIYCKLRASSALMAVGYYFSMIIMEKLKEEIGKASFKVVYNHIIKPFHPTIIALEQQAIERIRKSYCSKGKMTVGIKDEVNALAGQYGFLHSEYISNPWLANDYFREIMSRQTSEGIENDKQGSSSIKFQLSQYAKWLIEINRQSVYLYEDGKAGLVKANWALRQTLQYLKIDEKLFFRLNEKEFLKWAKTGQLPPKQELINRLRHYCLLLLNNQLEEHYPAKKVKEIIKEQGIIEFNKVKRTSTIKGMSSFPGKVNGLVRIVFSQAEAKKLRTGEILVASMTTPELLGGMRKASAFITDEGGILCHAAIVARELKKPCIIGTGNATEVLKDGDEVEVDADKGVVKIIKKS